MTRMQKLKWNEQIIIFRDEQRQSLICHGNETGTEQDVLVSIEDESEYLKINLIVFRVHSVGKSL